MMVVNRRRPTFNHCQSEVHYNRKSGGVEYGRSAVFVTGGTMEILAQCAGGYLLLCVILGIVLIIVAYRSPMADEDDYYGFRRIEENE